MSKFRRPAGNTLALTLVFMGLTIVSLAVLVMYYVQTLGAHKEAQTAIDAAALQAAKDVGEIYIDAAEGSHFGPVGVSDNIPPGNDMNKRPILGINTLMATVRLDALIAEQLGSSSMLVLAREDYEKARATSFKLQQKIKRACAGETVRDRNGHDINILDNATKVYDANVVKLGKGKRSGPIILSPGVLKSDQTMPATSTPVPQPVNLARVDGCKYDVNGVGFYLAGKEIKDHFAKGGKGDWTFEFVPLSSQSASLVDTALWSEISSSDYLVPTLIRAEAVEEINPLASLDSEEERKKRKPQLLRSYATSLCAFYGALPSTDGALKVSFPQTVPPSGYNIDFTSVQSIMTAGDANQIELTDVAADSTFQTVHTAKDLGTPSSYSGKGSGGKGWNDDDHGIYATAVGGAFPGQPGSSLGEPKHFHSRTEDNPSVVLSFLVYDWLKCMYVKPNISEVVKALKTPLTKSSFATSMNSQGFLQPAYAEIDTKYPVTFALCDLPRTGQGDPRNWNNYPNDPEGYRRQFANVFGYVPADITLPNSSLVVSIDNDKVVTTNGQPPGTLTDLFRALHAMNDVSSRTLTVAEEVQQKKLAEISQTEQFIVSNIDKKTGQPLNSTMVPALQLAGRQHDAAVMTYGRALIVMQNAKFGLQMSYCLLNDRKMLTSFGVTKVNDRTFELMPGHLYVPTRAATEQEILATGKISTGQDAAAGVCDWAALPADNERDQLQFFVSTKNSIVGHDASTFNLLAPALAASSIPAKDDNIYSFSLKADGSIHGVHETAATAGVNLLEGQVGYQNLASLVTDGGNCTDLQWNCVARDNVTNVAGAYFRNMAASITNILPGHSEKKPLACEWSLRCPVPVKRLGCDDNPCDPKVFKTISYGANLGTHPGASFGISNIHSTVDEAGNVRFTLKQGNTEKEMKFFDSYDRWSDAWSQASVKSALNIAGSTTNSLTLRGKPMTPVVLSQFYRAANGYTSGSLELDFGISDAKRKAINDRVRYNYDTAMNVMQNSARASEYFETFAKGMANLNVNGDYLKSINQLNASKNIDPSQDAALKALVYNAWMFYTEDESGCPHLYAWAS